jgi:hypothetical protein
MNFDDACNLLQGFVIKHTSLPLVVDGQGFLFEAGPRYTPTAISIFEHSVGKKLPEDYVKFLTTVGPGRFFIDDRGRGIDFVPLEKIQEFSKSVFDNFGDDLFPELLLVLSLPRVGGFGGFALDLPNRSRDCFSVFSAEDDPAEWVADATLCSFTQWLIRVCDSNGRQTWVE